MKHKIFKSSDTNVSKFVFEGDDIAVESVLYRYNSYKDRTVICCSTQCGCPVGCSFCGTGKFFVRNLTSEEIVEQIRTVLSYIDCNPVDIKKFQIMYMSMGEPLLNLDAVIRAIRITNSLYPNAQQLVSTSAPSVDITKFYDLVQCSIDIDKVGLQFSVHESNDEDRHKLIHSNTCSLSNIAYLGEYWAKSTHRKPFFNYCVHKGNCSEKNVKELLALFNPQIWECTLSVICEKDNSMKAAIESQLSIIKNFSSMMVQAGYSVRVFNPAGQDDIGGGCGQLWYFQKWLKDKNEKNKI